jgi:AcrR family transcriptional regulator
MTSSSSRPPSGVAYWEGKLALLDAAISVVAEGGLRRLTWRAVAQRAGVTHGLVAHHFGSRDALIAGALDLAVQRNIDSSRLVSGTDRPQDFAVDLVEMATTDADAQAFQYELILEARRNPELRPHVQTLLRTYRRNARLALVELGLPDDEPLADLIYAALDGLTFGIYAEDDPARARAALGRLQELLGFLLRHKWVPDQR